MPTTTDHLGHWVAPSGDDPAHLVQLTTHGLDEDRKLYVELWPNGNQTHALMMSADEARDLAEALLVTADYAELCTVTERDSDG